MEPDIVVLGFENQEDQGFYRQRGVVGRTNTPESGPST